MCKLDLEQLNDNFKLQPHVCAEFTGVSCVCVSNVANRQFFNWSFKTSTWEMHEMLFNFLNLHHWWMQSIKLWMMNEKAHYTEMYFSKKIKSNLKQLEWLQNHMNAFLPYMYVCLYTVLSICMKVIHFSLCASGREASCKKLRLGQSVARKKVIKKVNLKKISGNSVEYGSSGVAFRKFKC